LGGVKLKHLLEIQNTGERNKNIRFEVPKTKAQRCKEEHKSECQLSQCDSSL